MVTTVLRRCQLLQEGIKEDKGDGVIDTGSQHTRCQTFPKGSDASLMVEILNDVPGILSVLVVVATIGVLDQRLDDIGGVGRNDAESAGDSTAPQGNWRR